MASRTARLNLGLFDGLEARPPTRRDGGLDARLDAHTPLEARVLLPDFLPSKPRT